ncbi:MAG: hypothetical protein H6873_05805 [Hyphomicrobiaceae bacterium]|nr:hypothetical protein [Hyphomicrobiaceae bacterium]
MASKRLNLNVSEVSYEHVRHLAEITDSSISETVRNALRHYHRLVHIKARGNHIYEDQSGSLNELPLDFEADAEKVTDLYAQVPKFD